MKLAIIWLCCSAAGTLAYLLLKRNQEPDLIHLLFVIILPVLSIGMLALEALLREDGADELNHLAELEWQTEANMCAEPDERNQTVYPLYAAARQTQIPLRRDLVKTAVLDPERYLTTLNDAKADEDVEVVHYASTALVELREQYREELEVSRKAWQFSPADQNAAQTYLNAINRWLSGDFTGSARKKTIEAEKHTLEALLSKQPSTNGQKERPVVVSHRQANHHVAVTAAAMCMKESL